MKSKIKLIVGLGNPGPEYARTRHNAGFWFVDELAWNLKTNFSEERKFFGQIAKTTIAGENLFLLKPNTFMNRSGQSVLAVANFYKILPAEVLVVHDELDLDCGVAKLKFGGGNGGHNGLRDIQSKLSTADYWRLRLGIGHPGVKGEVINFVLKKPVAAEQELIDRAIIKALDIMPQVLNQQFEQAMKDLHTK